MKKRKLAEKIYIYILAFCIPFLIMVIAYGINGIYPGSAKTIFVSDMGAQYVSFYSFLRYMGTGYNNIMYQTMGALGGGYFGTWAYYTSDPLSVIVLFFDQIRLSDAFYFLTLIKISLCSVTFSIFLKKGHIKCNNSFVILVSSVSYALMSFNLIYSLNVMWISGSIMLPLVILGIDMILDSKNKYPFILFLAFSVIANYYTAYMIVLFCMLYFAYRVISDPIDLKRCIRCCLKLFFYGVLSALLSAWLWLPVLVDLAKGKFSENSKMYYGMIRTPYEVVRQIFPFSFSGITGKDSPPLYCGLLVTLFLILYFFQKKIDLRKRIGALAVVVVFFLSMLFNPLDVAWHCFNTPHGFPGRYSFVISFFIIILFVECFDYVFPSDEKVMTMFIKYSVIGLFVSADVMLNAIYSIYSLDHDRIAGGYLERDSYVGFYKMSETYKANDFNYPDRIASYFDFSHNDGFLFAIPSLDYYSSSYNYNVSNFFRNLGMNSINHYSTDSGICPVSASVLNVDGAVSFSTINEYGMMFDLFTPVSFGEGYALYRNPYAGSLGYLYQEDTFSTSVSDDVFENLNHLYHDFADENVFIRCEREDKETTPVDDIKNSWEITLHPEEGKHLFMYVSPRDYFENDMKGCNDYIYLNGGLVAFYTDAPDRYIVDLGYSDGTELHFLYESDNVDNEIYFYSFDDKLFVESVERLKKKGLYDIVYSDDGIEASINAEEDCNLAVFLSYENGYTIMIDGIPTEYTDYAGCVLSVPIGIGEHKIHITYYTPGLKLGIFISVLGHILLIGCLILTFKRKGLNRKL